MCRVDQRTSNFEVKFWERPSKYYIVEFTAVFVCLLLSWSRPHLMKWSSNFDNSRSLYLSFSNMINRCSNIWFNKNLKCHQFKKTKHNFFIFLKTHYFVMGGSIDMNVGVFWETSVGFLKSLVLQLFLKYSQSNVNLNVKSRVKSNCVENADGLF